jgi:sugar lactone lactonase YvrE
MVGSRTFFSVRVGLISLACLCVAPAGLNGATGASSADAAWKKAGADEGLRQAFERATYALKDSGHGAWRGANAAQRLTLEFDGREARLSHPDGSVNFHLTGYGYGDRLREPAVSKPIGAGNRVEYQRGDLTEWYVNGLQGLEQGFTLGQRPGEWRDGEPLVIALGVSGGLLPVSKTGDGAVLFESGKGVVLRYAGLKALDARGRVIPSRLEVRGSEIRLVVEDKGAQYPLVVDPLWSQQQELTASDGAANDLFGASVSVDGGTAVVGAFNKTVGSNIYQGAAYVFVRSGGIWSQQAELTAPDGAAGDRFGRSVSVSGSTTVIGAQFKTVNSNGMQGAAYVFVQSGGVWSLQQELTASDGATGDQFGASVSVCGDTTVIGAIGRNSSQGAAYVFVRSGGVWSQQQDLIASDGAAADEFGVSVSVSGNTAAIGAWGRSAHRGAAYVFVRNGGTWSQQQELTASDGVAGDRFGYSVSVSGDTAVSGAYGRNSYQGAAYLFTRSGGAWGQQQELISSYDVAGCGGLGCGFGSSVSVSGNTAVIGAYDIASSEGGAYVYVQNGEAWSQQQELAASDGAPVDQFGISVSVSGDTAFIGAYEKTINSQFGQGAAYAFVRPRLGTNSLLVGSAGGTSSVVLAYDAAWTATANDSFLHISSGSDSGTGSAVVVFTYDAFSGTGSRTGTLTIAGQIVTVTQAGTNYIGPYGTGTAITLVSGLAEPSGVAVDGSGNAYIADTLNNAIKEWNASTQQVTTLVSSGLNQPTAVAVDGSGDVYFADQGNQAIKEWSAASQQVAPLVSSGLSYPWSVAADVFGNVYLTDLNYNAVMEWSASTQQVTTLVSSGLLSPQGLAVDISGNVYIADSLHYAVKEWSPAAQQVASLVSSGLNYPTGISVDGSGNVYIADHQGNAIREWSASTQQLTTLVSSGLFGPGDVAVDGSGNVYIADTGNSAIKELPYAFVGPPSLTEPASAGTDSLLPVLPATTSLTGVYAPTSDSNWLTIGTIANGVVGFSFAASTSASPRVAHITLLGQQVTVTQNGLPLVPSVDIDAPVQGATVSGMVTVSGWAIDNTGTIGTAISAVQVLVDGTAVGTATYGLSRPDVCYVYPGRAGCPNVGYSYSLNTAALSAGSHTITVEATDSSSPPDTGSASVVVNVTSIGPPSVWIDSPVAGAAVSGTITVNGWAMDNRAAVGTAIGSVQVFVDGAAVGNATYGLSRPDVCYVYPGRPGCPNVGFSFVLNTAALTPGSHTIMVTATDSDNTPDTGSATVVVNVIGPPSVWIDSPVAGAAVSGTITVSGWAMESRAAVGTAIGGVQVFVDGTAVGNATYGLSRPDVCYVYPGRPGCPNVGFSFALNTATLTPGSHTIMVKATDSASFPVTGSASVVVNVTSIGSPSVWIDSPVAGAAVSGTITVNGWAMDNRAAVGTAIGSVQVFVDGTAVGNATYGLSRPDVCYVYPGRPGCPNVGFSFALNTATLTPGSHTIVVTATDSDTTPDTGSATVVVNVIGPPSVWIDSPVAGAAVSGTITVSGWAMESRAAVGTAIGSVQVFVDGTAVGNATYGLSRPDVCYVYPGRAGCPNVGFSFALNTAALSAGSHTITVQATDSSSPPDTGSATVTVQM